MKARFLLALSLAFGGVFFALPAQADEIVKVWENDSVGIYLPEGVTFTSVSGWYGAPDDANCGVDVSEVLSSLAMGQNSFRVDASNSVFGDPCGGVVKVLRITGIDANWQLPPIEPSPLPSEQPAVEEPTSPVPVETQLPLPSAEPEPLPTLAPLVEPSATPSPEPSIPSSLPSQDAADPIVPVLPPIVEPVVAPPAIVPQPQPQPIPFPVAPAPEPVAPEPTLPLVAPEPVVPTPVAPEPIPASPQPPVATPAPLAPVIVVTSNPEPSVSPPSPPVPIGDLVKQDPQTLTVAEIAQITEAATATLVIEPQGSPAYNQALEQLMVVAQADDPQIPTELAAIPLFGNAAVAVLDAFNQLGNFGSDISPKVRKQAKKEAIATIAVGTATTASAVAASGSVGYRRKETP